LVPGFACAAEAPKKKADPYADAVFVEGEPPLPAEGSFTFAVLPDTQYYCEKYPETFVAQTRWIIEQRERRRIAATFHLGDITNQNDLPQWKNARKALVTDATGTMIGNRTTAQPHVQHVEIDELLLAIVLQPPLGRLRLILHNHAAQGLVICATVLQYH
jgi:hypothetical protein